MLDSTPKEEQKPEKNPLKDLLFLIGAIAVLFVFFFLLKVRNKRTKADVLVKTLKEHSIKLTNLNKKLENSLRNFTRNSELFETVEILEDSIKNESEIIQRNVLGIEDQEMINNLRSEIERSMKTVKISKEIFPIDFRTQSVYRKFKSTRNPFVFEMKIGNLETKAMLDSGADCSSIASASLPSDAKIVENFKINATAIDGKKMEIKGIAHNFKVVLDEQEFLMNAIVLETQGFPFIIGMDMIYKYPDLLRYCIMRLL